jgi:hypothetical protein
MYVRKKAAMKKIVAAPLREPLGFGDLPEKALIEVVAEAARMLDRAEEEQERHG